MNRDMEKDRQTADALRAYVAMINESPDASRRAARARADYDQFVAHWASVGVSGEMVAAMLAVSLHHEGMSIGQVLARVAAVVPRSVVEIE